MLCKLGIALAVIVMGTASVQTTAFARGGGGHFGGGGGHFGGGGGHFGGGGGGHFGGGFGGRMDGGGLPGGHLANPDSAHGFGNRLTGRRYVRPFGFNGGNGSWYCGDWPYDSNYGYSCY